MKFEQYQSERETLINALETMVNAGATTEEFNAKKSEVEALDNRYEEATKQQANINAMKDLPIAQLQNLGGAAAPTQGTHAGAPIQLANGIAADPYNVITAEKQMENAFAKKVMGLELTNEEMQNVHTTEKGGVMVPQHTADRIIGLVSEQFPFFGDVYKYDYKGILVLPRHKAITSGDAAFYDEATPTVTEDNEFDSIVFGAKEVAKLVEVSFKLEAMSIDSFMSYITRELSVRIGRAVGTSVYNGTNTQKSFNGVITVLKAQASTPQIVTYAKGTNITYAHLTQAMGKVSSEFHAGIAIYANSTTVWEQLANITAQDGKPMFIADVTGSGVARLFGKPVKVDAGLPDGVVVVGNAVEGYAINTQLQLNVKTQEELRTRKTLISGLTILDGQVTREDALALIAPNA